MYIKNNQSETVRWHCRNQIAEHSCHDEIATKHLELSITLENIAQWYRKTNPIAGKGHNETLKFVNPLAEQSDAKNVNDGHVPENGGT
jgi:hypothetical protein